MKASSNSVKHTFTLGNLEISALLAETRTVENPQDIFGRNVTAEQFESVSKANLWSLAYPDWEVKFDMDKTKAAATRKQVFGMLAADKIPFAGYHMPFPGIGFVETRGDSGYRYIPISYQTML